MSQTCIDVPPRAVDSRAEPDVQVAPKEEADGFYCITGKFEGFELVIDWVEEKDIEQASELAKAILQEIVHNKDDEDPLLTDPASTLSMRRRLEQALRQVGPGYKYSTTFDGAIQLWWRADGWRITVALEPGEPSHLYAVNVKKFERANRFVPEGSTDLDKAIRNFQDSFVS